MHIRFDVPADPAYAARVATVLSDVYLRKYRYIGFGLIAVGLIGLWVPIGGTSSAVTYPAANKTQFTLASAIHHLDTLGLAYTKPGSGATRVIVEFPAGMQPPAEGSSFERDDARPFMVTDIRRGADGQVNLYVREVTTPE